MYPRVSRVPAALVLSLLLAGTAACGDSTQQDTEGTRVEATPQATPTGNPTATPPEPQGTEVAVRFTEDSVSPAGKRVRLEVGEKLVLAIDAAVAGEIHVHSSPEQEIAYPRGSSTATIQIEQPGIVEVESHTLHKLILELEVR